MKKFALGAALLVAMAAPALAADRGLLVYGVVGTGGSGVGAGIPLSEKFGARAEIARWTKDYETEEDGIKYKGEFKLQTTALFVDYHPFGGIFRLTAGVDFAGPKAAVSAETTGGMVNVNGKDYNMPAGEGITGTIEYPSTMPYLGIGWGMGNLAKSGWRFGVDAGVDIGKARGKLTATPGLSSQAGFDADFAAEQKQFDEDVSKVKVFPVVKLSLGYAF